MEFILNGPEDMKEEVVTRKKDDYADFFDTYRCLSRLIPYISHCLPNLDKFYVSRGRIDLLPMFRPCFHHLHNVRDKETFSLVFNGLSKSLQQLIHKDMIKDALENKSYGLLRTISVIHGINLKYVKEIKSLEFSMDLLSLLENLIDWKEVTLNTITHKTNPDVLLKEIEKEYIDTSSWSVEAVISKPRRIFEVINCVMENYFFSTTDEFVEALLHMMKSSCSIDNHAIIQRVIEKTEFPRDFNVYTICSSISNTLRCFHLPMSSIFDVIVAHNIIPFDKDTFPLEQSLKLFLKYQSVEGILYINDKLKFFDNIDIGFSSCPNLDFLMHSPCDNFIVQLVI